MGGSCQVFSIVDDEKNMYDIYKAVKMVEQPMEPVWYLCETVYIVFYTIYIVWSNKLL